MEGRTILVMIPFVWDKDENTKRRKFQIIFFIYNLLFFRIWVLYFANVTKPMCL